MAKQQATTPSLQLNPQTLTFLGLSQQPFTAGILTGDAIYTDATRDQMIATLKHHMQFSDLVLIVEGEQGSGKTTLFRQLIQDRIPNLFLMSILAEPTDTLVQLQQKMAVHLKSQGSANYLDQDLKNLQVFDQFPIAIMDDAHVLSDTTLQELIRYRSQLKRDKDTNLKILLFANPGMAKTLEDISELQHNQLYVQQMPELSVKQTQAFIDQRLTTAGYRGSTVLPPETIQQIQKKSRGRPGQIMSMAALMLEKHVRNFNQPGGNLLVKIFGAATLLLVVAGGVHFWMQSLPAPTPQIIVEKTDEPIIASEPVTTPDMPESTEAIPTDSAEPNSPAISTEQAIAPGLVDKATITTPVAENSAPPTGQPADLSTSGIAPPTPVTPTEIKTDAGVDASTPVATPATAAAPANIVAAPPAVEPKPVISPVEKPVKATNQKALSELAVMGIKDSEWLHKQNPAHWTLQLLATYDTDTLLKFAHEHKLGDDSAWYQTQRNGKPWYVLVHRFYTSADAARKGLETLPPDIKRDHPWVKSMTAIQKDLAK